MVLLVAADKTHRKYTHAHTHTRNLITHKKQLSVITRAPAYIYKQTIVSASSSILLLYYIYTQYNICAHKDVMSVALIGINGAHDGELPPRRVPGRAADRFPDV